MTDLRNLRGLVKSSNGIKPMRLIDGLDPEDINILQREVMRVRGELLFSKAIVLFEGVTEEQLIPAMFLTYFGVSNFSLGVTCISVSGKNYPPFIKMALSFGIPVCIISDNDGNTKAEIESQIKKIENDTSLELSDDQFGFYLLSQDNDIEIELVSSLNMKDEIIEAIVKTETRGSSNEHYVAAKTEEIRALNDVGLIASMHSAKSSYASFLADIISRNPNNKTREDMVPLAAINAFEKIKNWL